MDPGGTMEQYNHIISVIALSMGAAWASGINLYAAILVLGLLGTSGHLILPADLQILMNPLVLFAAGAMYLVEFFADKIPGVDNSWDALHTFIRIPAGAAMAVGAVGDVDPAVSVAVAIVGGGLAAGVHATKAGSRVLINVSPEPFTNWVTSLSEDVLVIVGLWTALHYPSVFVVFLLLCIVMMVWLLPKLWRGVKWVIARLKNFCSGRGGSAPPSPGLKIPEALPDFTQEYLDK